MEIHRVVVGPFDNNVFIVRCRATGDAALIDAANEHELLLDLCHQLGVRTVLETHGHHDHIGAVPQIRDAGYDVHVTAGDAHMLPAYDQILEGDSAVEVGRLRLLTTITPGHTAGSICFKVDGSPVLFAGDTLFPGGPGLTRDGFEFREGKPPAAEFPCGDFATIIRSIDELIFSPPTRARDHRHARPRRRHHDRPREPPPTGVDRPRLVSRRWPQPPQATAVRTVHCASRQPRLGACGVGDQP